MNKPNKENYIMDGRLISSVYMMVLEEYVEDLEQRLCNSDFNLQCLDKDITKLEKALNKACEWLSWYCKAHYLFPTALPNDLYPNKTSLEEWKEWALKDE